MTHSFPNFEPVSCSIPVLTVASLPAYRFLRRLVRWSGILISLRIFHSLSWRIHTVKCFSVVNEAKIDVFLDFSCFFYDPTIVGNLTSGFSAFSKSRLYIWKFFIQVLLNSSLRDFEYKLTRYEVNCAVVRHSLALPFFGIGVNTDLFQSCFHC